MASPSALNSGNRFALPMLLLFNFHLLFTLFSKKANTSIFTPCLESDKSKYQKKNGISDFWNWKKNFHLCISLTYPSCIEHAEFTGC
ncbi:hypothetical protein MRB53_002019 [Persea americana]|uniref:Uncharacterized protein n=1 Tax=Persea americana TaxID=3435 RepID=A0ACC2MU88_PERAE|nr:hypothetical protein MRB53_002019 [Persea americana]